MSSSSQIRRRIDLLLLAKAWVSAHGDFSTNAGAVAPIAIPLRVHEIASQSYQSPVLALQVQRDRRNIESLLNPWIFLIVPVIAVICLSSRRTEEHSCTENQGKSHGGSHNFAFLTWRHLIFLSSALCGCGKPFWGTQNDLEGVLPRILCLDSARVKSTFCYMHESLDTIRALRATFAHLREPTSGKYHD